MRKLTFGEATREAMIESMAADKTVFVMGEDIARQGGIFGQFKDMAMQFPDRVIDTPISETFLVGGGVGAAMAGARPVVDLHYADFMGVCMDEICNQMAKAHYMFGGQTNIPMVLRAPDGIIVQGAAQHSQSVEAWFTHIPGLKIVAPYHAEDAKAVLKAAIADDNPVVYFEHKKLFPVEFSVPEKADEAVYEIGKAKVRREGADLTIVSWSKTVGLALEAAMLLEKEGISCEVIDLISLTPWDRDCVLASVEKTGRLVIAHEAVKQSGFGAEIAAAVAEDAFGALKAPVIRIAAPFVPVPFSPTLEENVRLTAEKIADGARRAVSAQAALETS